MDTKNGLRRVATAIRAAGYIAAAGFIYYSVKATHPLLPMGDVGIIVAAIAIIALGHLVAWILDGFAGPDH